MSEPSRRTAPARAGKAAPRSAHPAPSGLSPGKRPPARRNSKKRRSRTGRRIGLWGRWYIIVPVALVVLCALVFAWYYHPLQIAYHEARNERVLGAQLKGINAYNAQLQSEIESLETTAGVADYARRELNLVEQGDHVVIVTRDGKPITSQEDSRVALLEDSEAVKQPFGAWTDFLDRLFGPR